MEVDTGGLAEFLTARLGEQMAAAAGVHRRGCAALDDWNFRAGVTDKSFPDGCDCGEPARVQARAVAAQRLVRYVVEDQYDSAYGESGFFVPLDWMAVLQLLATPHALHADYQERWRPRLDD